MRFFTPAADTRFYAGVDLHARSLFIDAGRRSGAVADHPPGDRHHHALRPPAAVLLVCAALRRGAGVGGQAGRGGQPPAGQRLTEVGLLRGRRPQRAEERADRKHLEKLTARLGKPKALSVLAYQLGRAFYRMLHTQEVFDVNRFVRH